MIIKTLNRSEAQNAMKEWRIKKGNGSHDY